jgi:NAD(P)-dependent dehydrogenase (short-subunit alcohol dehydrogenase family)
MHDKQVALITGANKGIGKEIARQLGKRGLTVLVAARDAGRGETAAKQLRDEGLDARFIHLDVTAADTVARAAKQVEAELGRLDVLVNNAGIAVGRAKASEVDLDSVRKTFETNVFAVIAVTQAFLPLLRKAPNGRIVNISSGLGSLARMSDPKFEFATASGVSYPASKTALNAVTVAFANELRQTRIKVNAADPGYTATDLNNHSGPRTVEQGARAAVRLATLNEDGPTGTFIDEDGPQPW